MMLKKPKEILMLRMRAIGRAGLQSSDTFVALKVLPSDSLGVLINQRARDRNLVSFCTWIPRFVSTVG